MSSLFSIGDDELDLDDEDFLLQACETASLSLSSNLKGKSDKLLLGNSSKLFVKEKNAGSYLCRSGLRSPLSSICDNAVTERGGSEISSVSSRGNNNHTAGSKFLTSQGQSLNSKPNGLSYSSTMSTFSSNKCCLSPPSKRLAVEANLLSNPRSSSGGVSSINMFRRGTPGLGSSTHDPSSGHRETDNLPIIQRSCSLQMQKYNSVNIGQGHRQNFASSQEINHPSNHKSPVILRDTDCDMGYISKCNDDGNQDKRINLKGNSKDRLQNHSYIEKQTGNWKNSIGEVSSGQSTKSTDQPKSSDSGLGLNDNSLVIQTPNKPRKRDLSSSDTPLKMPQGTPRTRKFPGPAGVLPKLSPNQDLDKLVLPQLIVRNSPAVPKKAMPLTSNEDEDFNHDPWLTMATEFNQGVPSSMRYTVLQALTKAAIHELHRGKVPGLCVLVKSFLPTGTDASILLKDPTGEIHGTVHRKVLEEYSSEFSPGSGLVLKQVSVFSPCPRKHYLNITPGNIVELYPAGSTSAFNSQPLATQFTQKGITTPVQRMSVDDESTGGTDKLGSKSLEVEDFVCDTLDNQLLLNDELLVEASQLAADSSSDSHELQQECYDDLLEGLENEDHLLDEALLV